jgi:hypothetical protein
VRWNLEESPLRPHLVLAEAASREDIAAALAEGVHAIARAYEFGGLQKLKLSRAEARERIAAAAASDDADARTKADLWSALVNDAAARANDDAVQRTPFCLLDVAQTSFLKNLSEVFSPDVLPRKDREKSFVASFGKALFAPWQRQDSTPSFRWDPVEDSRYAFRWTAPGTDKQPVEHGANMLGAIGLSLITVVPAQRGPEVRLQTLGGTTVQSEFTFSWPIWRHPLGVSAIRALLSHPDLRTRGSLARLGVDSIRTTRRFNPPNSKYANFTAAVPG